MDFDRTAGFPNAYDKDEITLHYVPCKRKEIIMSNFTNMMDQVPTEYAGKGCTPNPTPFPQNTPVAMAYVPFQQFGPLYSPENGFDRGTIFPELDKPFLGGGGLK
jgi:hypothetical protein